MAYAVGVPYTVLPDGKASAVGEEKSNDRNPVCVANDPRSPCSGRMGIPSERPTLYPGCFLCDTHFNEFMQQSPIKSYQDLIAELKQELAQPRPIPNEFAEVLDEILNKNNLIQAAIQMRPRLISILQRQKHKLKAYQSLQMTLPQLNRLVTSPAKLPDVPTPQNLQAEIILLQDTMRNNKLGIQSFHECFVNINPGYSQQILDKEKLDKLKTMMKTLEKVRIRYTKDKTETIVNGMFLFLLISLLVIVICIAVFSSDSVQDPSKVLPFLIAMAGFFIIAQVWSNCGRTFFNPLVRQQRRLKNMKKDFIRLQNELDLYGDYLRQLGILDSAVSQISASASVEGVLNLV